MPPRKGIRKKLALSDFRALMGVTQRDMALFLGISQPTLYRAERLDQPLSPRANEIYRELMYRMAQTLAKKPLPPAQTRSEKITTRMLDRKIRRLESELGDLRLALHDTTQEYQDCLGIEALHAEFDFDMPSNKKTRNQFLAATIRKNISVRMEKCDLDAQYAMRVRIAGAEAELAAARKMLGELGAG